MNAGDLRHRITIQVRAGGVDSFGDRSTTYTTLADVWALVAPLQGRELFAAQQVRAEVTHRIVTRYLRGVRSSGRILFDGRTFEIAQVIDPQERHEMLELIAIEVED